MTPSKKPVLAATNSCPSAKKNKRERKLHEFVSSISELSGGGSGVVRYLQSLSFTMHRSASLRYFKTGSHSSELIILQQHMKLKDEIVQYLGACSSGQEE